MFIINPDLYSLPTYRIGPFQTKDLSVNHTLPDSDLIDEYFLERFPGKCFEYTINGRQAMDIAIGSLKLHKDDVISILTTSGNFYISGCVTSTIEKYCKWSREMLPETRAIFVNHEFGYPYPGMEKLKEFGLPIIEDCAGSFFSQDKDCQIGEVGDFVVYSFPKMFPLQIGGLLVSKDPDRLERNNMIGSDELRHIKNVLSSQLGLKEQIIQQRFFNYGFLRDKFASLGYIERFEQDAGAVPGVFMFRTEGRGIDLPEMKKHFFAHGIQCSVFYGEEAFFIPVHQSLNEQDMEYFFEVFKSFSS